MKTLKSITLAAFIGLMLTTAGSFAQNNNRPAKPNNIYQNIPNLTEQQKKEIEELRTAYQKEVKELRDEFRSSSQRDQRDNFRQKMLSKRKTHTEAIRELLTDEQKVVFDKNIQNRQDRSARGRGSRGKGSRGQGDREFGSGDGNKGRGGSGQRGGGGRR